MRNGKERRRIKVCKRKKEGREKDRRKKGEGRRKKREGGWGKRRFFCFNGIVICSTS